MNLNLKIFIALSLTISIVSLLLWNVSVSNELERSKKSFHKLSNELHLIKTIKEYYGEAKNNKKKLAMIISKYKNNIVFAKEDKESIEYKIKNLHEKDLDYIVKNIVDKGFKVLNMKVHKTTSDTTELSFKVLF